MCLIPVSIHALREATRRHGRGRILWPIVRIAKEGEDFVWWSAGSGPGDLRARTRDRPGPERSLWLGLDGDS